MKKTIIVILMCLTVSMAFVLSACGEQKSDDSGQPAEAQSAETLDPVYDEYLGNVYTATDPWGGKATIQVNDEGDHVECVFTDELTSNVHFESSIYLQNGDTETDFMMGTSGDNWEATYEGSFEMTDGTLVITYTDGALTEKSSNGDSDSHQVGPLDEASRTIVFQKQ